MTDTTKPTIRPLAPQDRAQWEPMWRAYLAFYETSLPPTQYDLTWQRLQDATEPMHALGAFAADGRLIGLAHVIFHRSCWLPDWTCYLQDLFVDAATRGSGTGAALIEATADLARQKQAGRLYWLTQETNTPARRLYDHIAAASGFVQYRKPL
ncbi:ribosomal protein S18 acetylase RimI-like enzyme [Rhizobium sp. PP-F2F-G48]|uniref:GNAT family N-acetyltransferase n=1 Tax=Rhizobium sp. PP-F2F-G48 TaxID=2135651 RepID=UPI00104A4281|nr:GNAT family N-acetyltransferase [Rhizobium sp. PP-F2F-G48]TCM58919.1 ribosomal protein S18 acetylase RimI-like enzyme [Rhizobium sp. PP-F2F-G48]